MSFKTSPTRRSAKMTLSLGILALLALAILPLSVSAQGTGGGVTIAVYISTALTFINTYVIPLLFAIAFIMFIWGITKFLIIKGASDEDRSNGKTLALWGVLAFVFLLSIWGLTNLVITGFGIQNGKILCPDYNKNCTGGNGTTQPGGTQTPGTGASAPRNTYQNLY